MTDNPVENMAEVSAAAAPPDPPGQDSVRELLKNRNFCLFLATRVMNMMGTQMLGVANAWQIYDIAHTPQSLGYAGLALFVPFIIFALPGGDLADRYDRRLIIIGSNTLQTMAALALLALTLSHSHNLVAFYSILGVIGIARSLYAPASQSVLPMVITMAQMQRGLALSQSALQSSIVIAPALAGFLFVVGPGLVYGCCALLSIGVAIAFWLIRLPMLKRADDSGLNALGRIVAGLEFVRARPILLGAISLDLFAVFLGGTTALLPVYARDILHTGPVGLGMLRSSMAFGAAGAGIYLSTRPLQGNVGYLLLVCVGAFGVATIIFGVSTNFALSLAMLACLGVTDMISVNIRQTIVQTSTPDHMRGRVSALSQIFVNASNELGEFRSGMTAGFLGTVPAVVLGGVGTIVVVAVWSKIFPALRDVDRMSELKAS
jgi:MFS family permease